MQSIKRVIPLAKDRALIKYSALVRLMLKDADESMAQALTAARSGAEQYRLSEALGFLRKNSAVFSSRMETLFRESVERAMRTMYTDLRQGLTNLSADTLSLIDDETVNRQLEVGHLVQRLRDACDENLGRLNIMIAQIHGDSDVHERENPFRPYLHARVLYEALREKVEDEGIAEVLFDHLSNSLANHLSDYYASICDVFDASGIQARLLARPTKLKRHQRDQLAQQLAARNAPGSAGIPSININGGDGTASVPTSAPMALPADFNLRILPALERVMDLMQQSGLTQLPMPVAGQTPAQTRPAHASVEFQDLIWKIFNPAPAAQPLSLEGSTAAESSAALAESPGMLAPASPELLSRLAQFQQIAANGQALDDSISADQNQLFALGEQLSDEEATQGERVAIDVVAMLFEFILEDEQIPAAMRLQLGRLQIPFLKAAMLAPELLQDANHPARKLLNRLSSAAIGVESDTAIGKNLDQEMSRIVKRVLQEFDQDVGIFTDCLEELERFLEQQLHNADKESALSAQAAAEAEQLSVLLLNTQSSLRDLLAPLQIDQRVSDFIVQIWARVLVRAAMQDAKNGASGNAASEQYRDVLPELVWSAQEKQTAEDRNALIRLLPSLVKRLKIGMLMIHLPEAECKAALDQMVAVHTQILRSNATTDLSKKLPGLEALRQQFSRLVMDQESASWTLAAPPQVTEDVVESVLANRGASAEVEMQQASEFSSETDAGWLAQIQLGTCVQFWAADTFVLARLIWISKHQSLYIFKMDQNAKPLIYSAAALVKALREEAIRLVEYAPVFDRAVDSLLMGAEAAQAGRRQ